MAFWWAGGRLSNTCLDISSGSNMNQKLPLRPVATALLISSSRKEIRLVELVTAASSDPVCIAA